MANHLGTVGITGASGQLGSEVLRQLRAAGTALRVVATTRTPHGVPQLLDLADEVREADFARADTLQKAFAGIDRLLIISIEGPDATRLALHRAALEAAIGAGVGHVLYAGFLDVHPDSPSTVAQVHRLTEEMIGASGVRFTALRNGPYLENMAGRAAAAAAEDGVLRWSADQARLPFISRGDIAAAAAAVLATGAPEGPVILTGSQLLGFADLCALVSARLGKPVRYQSMDDADFAEECRRQGLAEEYVERRVAYGRAMRLGFMTALSDDFARIVGRLPISAEAAIRAMRFD